MTTKERLTKNKDNQSNTGFSQFQASSLEQNQLNQNENSNHINRHQPVWCGTAETLFDPRFVLDANSLQIYNQQQIQKPILQSKELLLDLDNNNNNNKSPSENKPTVSEQENEDLGDNIDGANHLKLTHKRSSIEIKSQHNNNYQAIPFKGIFDMSEFEQKKPQRSNSLQLISLQTYCKSERLNNNFNEYEDSSCTAGKLKKANYFKQIRHHQKQMTQNPLIPADQYINTPLKFNEESNSDQCCSDKKPILQRNSTTFQIGETFPKQVRSKNAAIVYRSNSNNEAGLVHLCTSSVLDNKLYYKKQTEQTKSIDLVNYTSRSDPTFNAGQLSNTHFTNMKVLADGLVQQQQSKDSSNLLSIE